MSRAPFLLSMALAICSFAAEAQTDTPLLAGIAHVAIRVSDLTRSRDFYQKLGFEEAFTLTKDGVTTESFLKVNDRQFIEMYPKQQPSQPIGFMHVCFEGVDLEVLNRDYLARGLSPNPVKRAGAGNLLFTMEGPEKQNIEYTQYMPGSLHSNDQGKHLGANRISTELVAFGLAMKDELAAEEFYRQKLGFQPLQRFFEPGLMALQLPGPSRQAVQITPAASACKIFFTVSNLGRAAARLKMLHLSVLKQPSVLTIQDPDGNPIVFVKE
jgi:catechol 2,3-dioxygenase-like lactoylglutathione lyase family enzyme